MAIRCIFCVLTAAILFSMTAVFAQEAPSSAQSEPRTRVIYREKSYFDFEDTLIRGDRIGPEGSSVFRKDRVEFRSSLDLKRSFIPELRSSSQDVR